MALRDDFSRGVPSSEIWGALVGERIGTVFPGKILSSVFSDRGERYAQTKSIDTRFHRSLEFDLIYGNGINGAEVNRFDVSLEYSTNNGLSWGTLQTYSNPTEWTRFKVNLPVAAQAANTLIRWRQSRSSDPGLDVWALDDVSFLDGALEPQESVDFSHGSDDGFWSDISNAQITNTFAGRTESLFFGGRGARFAQTVALNTLKHKALRFDLIYGDGTNGTSQNRFPVNLEFSTNNGESFQSLQSYSMPVEWTRFEVNLPVAAQTSSTLIRWNQSRSSDPGLDVWALDDIKLLDHPVLPPAFVDFSDGFADGLWSDISNARITNTFAGRSQSLFFGASGSRFAQTAAINTTNYTSLQFDLIDGNGTNGGAINRFPVSLEFSTDRGLSWGTLQTYAKTSEWTRFKVNLPVSAQTDNTLIRWSQSRSSDPGLDVWALDNIRFVLGYTPGITTVNGVNLGVTPRGDYALRKGSDFAVLVSFDGQAASPNRPGSGWTAIAAATVGADYELYWKNKSQYARWLLDSEGEFESGTLLSEAELFSAESRIKHDLNGDGAIGLPYTSGPTTVQGTNLGISPFGYAIKPLNASPLLITVNGTTVSPSYPGSGWSALSALATSASAYSLYWRQGNSERYSRWSLNGDGVLTSSEFLSSRQLYEEETSRNVDLNADDRVGLPFTPGSSTINGLSLGSSPLGYAIKTSNSSPLLITINGKPVNDSLLGSAWSPISAVATSPGSTALFWRKSGSDLYSRWTLDDKGAHAASELLSPSQFYVQETSRKLDLNHDGVIGLPYTPGAVQINGLNLGSSPLGHAIKPSNGSPLLITVHGIPTSGSFPGGGWTPLSAISTGANSYSLFWGQRGTDLYSRWTLDAEGAHTGSELLSSRQFYEQEISRKLDLNNDAVVGFPYTAGPNTINGLNLGTTPSGYAFQAPNASPVLITFNGTAASAANPGGGWFALAIAAVTPSLHALYWQNAITRQVARWTVNATSGSLVGSEILAPAQLRQGGPGDDLLIGASGPDIFTFRSGAAFNTSSHGVDAILNFTGAEDTLRLSRTTFTALGSGVSLAPSQFATITRDADAPGSQAQVLYNSTNGNVFYNPNGAAAGFATTASGGGLFAQLLSGSTGAPLPALTASQVVLIA